MSLKTAFWIYIFGSIAGVFIEMIYCAITRGFISSRQGVIYGPFNPLYGVGAVLMSYFLLPIKDKNNIHLFFGGFVIGSIVEYVFHFGQAYLFDTYSWDYTNKLLNVNGRIDLYHSICWGLLGIVWIRSVYPYLENLISKIKPKTNKILTVGLTIFMFLDIFISCIAVGRWSDRVLKNAVPQNNIDVFLDTYYNDEFLEKIYPNMKMVNIDK